MDLNQKMYIWLDFNDEKYSDEPTEITVAEATEQWTEHECRELLATIDWERDVLKSVNIGGHPKATIENTVILEQTAKYILDTKYNANGDYSYHNPLDFSVN